MTKKLSLQDQAKALLNVSVSSDDDKPYYKQPYARVNNFQPHSIVPLPQVSYLNPLYNNAQRYNESSSTTVLPSSHSVMFQNQSTKDAIRTPSKSKSKSVLKTSEKKRKSVPKLTPCSRQQNMILKKQVNEQTGSIQWFQSELDRVNQITNNQLLIINELRNENESLKLKEQNLMIQIEEQSSISCDAIAQISALQNLLEKEKKYRQKDIIKFEQEKEQIKDELEVIYERKMNEKLKIKTLQIETEVRAELTRKYEAMVDVLKTEERQKAQEMNKLTKQLRQLEENTDQQTRQNSIPDNKIRLAHQINSLQSTEFMTPTMLLKRKSKNNSPKKVFFSGDQGDSSQLSLKQQMLASELKALNSKLENLRNNRSHQ